VRTADLSPESHGRLVEIWPGVPAFVPDPMPDELTLDYVAIRLLSDAEHAIGRLVGAVGRTVNPFLVGSSLLHLKRSSRAALRRPSLLPSSSCSPSSLAHPTRVKTWATPERS
jgi:hypothetical protein